MCTTPIPPDRKKDGITCSKDCTKARRQYLRSLKDHSQCRYCYKPSTPEERSRFHAWMKWEAQGVPQTDSAAQLLRIVEKLKRKVTELDGTADPEAVAEELRKRIVREESYRSIELENLRLKEKLAKLTGSTDVEEED